MQILCLILKICLAQESTIESCKKYTKHCPFSEYEADIDINLVYRLSFYKLSHKEFIII